MMLDMMTHGLLKLPSVSSWTVPVLTSASPLHCSNFLSLCFSFLSPVYFLAAGPAAGDNWEQEKCFSCFNDNSKNCLRGNFGLAPRGRDNIYWVEICENTWNTSPCHTHPHTETDEGGHGNWSNYVPDDLVSFRENTNIDTEVARWGLGRGPWEMCEGVGGNLYLESGPHHTISCWLTGNKECQALLLDTPPALTQSTKTGELVSLSVRNESWGLVDSIQAGFLLRILLLRRISIFMFSEWWFSSIIGSSV